MVKLITSIYPHQEIEENIGGCIISIDEDADDLYKLMEDQDIFNEYIPVDDVKQYLIYNEISIARVVLYYPD